MTEPTWKKWNIAKEIGLPPSIFYFLIITWLLSVAMILINILPVWIT